MNAFAALMGAVVIASEPPGLPGEVLPYDDAAAVANATGRPMVTFYGIEPRPLPGFVTAYVPEGCDLPGIPKPSVTVCAFALTRGLRQSHCWPHDVTDAQVAEKARELEQRLRLVRAEVVAPAQAAQQLPPAVLRQLRPSFQKYLPQKC